MLRVRFLNRNESAMSFSERFGTAIRCVAFLVFQSPATPAQVVPLVDYHLHLFSPAILELSSTASSSIARIKVERGSGLTLASPRGCRQRLGWKGAGAGRLAQPEVGEDAHGQLRKVARVADRLRRVDHRRHGHPG